MLNIEKIRELMEKVGFGYDETVSETGNLVFHSEAGTLVYQCWAEVCLDLEQIAHAHTDISEEIGAGLDEAGIPERMWIRLACHIADGIMACTTIHIPDRDEAIRCRLSEEDNWEISECEGPLKVDSVEKIPALNDFFIKYETVPDEEILKLAEGLF